MREVTRAHVKAEGKVVVGEWGLGTPSTSGHIICASENRDNVAAAYDAIKDGDLSSEMLDDVISAGGEHVVGM